MHVVTFFDTDPCPALLPLLLLREHPFGVHSGGDASGKATPAASLPRAERNRAMARSFAFGA